MPDGYELYGLLASISAHDLRMGWLRIALRGTNSTPPRNPIAARPQKMSGGLLSKNRGKRPIELKVPRPTHRQITPP